MWVGTGQARQGRSHKEACVLPACASRFGRSVGRSVGSGLRRGSSCPGEPCQPGLPAHVCFQRHALAR